MKVKHKLVAVVGVLVLTMTMASPAAFAAGEGGSTPIVTPGNFLKNPDFEEGSGAGGGSTLTSWTPLTAGKSGRQNNNPYSGSYGFYVDSGKTNGISQKVTVPYSGWYATSGYISQGSTGGVFALRNSEGDILAGVEIPRSYSKDSPTKLPVVELVEGDLVEVVALGGSGWVNGDDLALTYSASNIRYDLLSKREISIGSQELTLPRKGGYDLGLTVKAGASESTVTIGTEVFTIAAGETQNVSARLSANAPGDIVTISIASTSPDVTVSGATCLFDVDSVPHSTPTASDVKVAGSLMTGSTVTGHYIFDDPDADESEGDSRFAWQSSENPGGPFVPIAGLEDRTATIGGELQGKYLRFEVTPQNSSGFDGLPVASSPLGPVITNWILNPGFEINSGNVTLGWRASGTGASISNDPPNARGGSQVGNISANNATGELIYTLIPEESGVYDLSTWIKQRSGTGTTELGVRYAFTKEIISTRAIEATTSYAQHVIPGIALEEGTEVEIFLRGNSGSSAMYSDDFALTKDPGAAVPRFMNLKNLSAAGQISLPVVDPVVRAIALRVPFGTEVSSILVEASVSAGATIAPASGSVVDFSSGPVTFTVANGVDPDIHWTVSVEVADKVVQLSAGNDKAVESFAWAVEKTNQFVTTGKDVPLEMWAGHPATRTITGAPSYWAGYYDRSAYYGRDFAHQTTGAEIVGLSEENFQMFEAFAKASTLDRKWYSYWAINFDNETPLGIDYRSDDNFVREVPAMFEIVEKAYKQYLWNGDTRYLNPEMMTFYGHVMNEFVAFHDTNGNGIAEGDPAGGGIFKGSATYNERGSHPLEAGDAIGSQYQASLAYAGLLKAVGSDDESAIWEAKAAQLKDYFNSTWSIIPGASAAEPGGREGLYVNILDIAGKQYADFGKENSWFIPMKLITEPGSRNDAYLDFITANLGDGIGSNATAPKNIEAYTYIPDTYFAYNKSDEAWRWMEYIIDLKDQPHERPIQGTNGDYPEISFTLVSQVVEGMMGIEPDARLNSLATISRVPADIGTARLDYLTIGANELSVAHEGTARSTVTNVSGPELNWQARFYGTYRSVMVDGVEAPLTYGDLNGEAITYVSVPLGSGESSVVEVGEDIADSLQNLIDSSSALVAKDYLSATWAPLESALAEAKLALSDPNATGQDLAHAYQSLADAVGGLVLRGDTSYLATLVESAQSLRGEDYTPDSWGELLKAIASAQDTIGKDEVSVDEVSQRVADLTAALGNLQNADPGDMKAGLRALYDSVVNTDAQLFTEASWKVFEAALSEGKAVLDNDAASQTEIDSATMNLAAAFDSLELRTEGPLPSTPDPIVTAKPTPSPKAPPSEKLPTTGSEIARYALVSALVLAAGSGLLMAARRRWGARS